MFLTMGAAAAAVMFLQGPFGALFGGTSALPGGGYANSCRDARVTQDRLTAQCADRTGRQQLTSIPFARCAGYPIENVDGRLQCGQLRGDVQNAGPGPGGPGGGFPGGPGARFVAYEDVDYRGRTMTFSSEVADLSRTPFNDRISSFRLQGAWEICTDAYFQGQCQIVGRSEANLLPLRLNDSISSIRPARR